MQTVDFFTPIVDDPVAYGRIAARQRAVRRLRDGRPAADRAGDRRVSQGRRPRDPVANLQGRARRRSQEAGVALLGGHTVQDQEIKFGYAVTGEVTPARIWTNAGARPGDRLFLTKPLGTGVIATAIKFDRAPRRAGGAAIASMTHVESRRRRGAAALPAGDAVHACTDVTGFGLIGHGTEMARASGVHARDRRGGASRCCDGALDLVERNTPGRRPDQPAALRRGRRDR